MEKHYTFIPDVRKVAFFSGLESIEALSNEMDIAAGVYAASPNFVREHCGPIANKILNAVPESYYTGCRAAGMLPNIDVRIHRLNPGEFPAVPGWHCDGALRETYFAQPDIGRTPVRETLVATVSSDPSGVSLTEFAGEAITVNLPGNPMQDFSLWKHIHQQVPKHFRTVIPGDGVLIGCDVNTLHRCTPARVRGWRLFFRISWWHTPYLGQEGKIANQQQVYIISESCGW